MFQDGCSCQKAALIFIIIWSSITLLTCVLVAFSFSTVELNQVGLKYDTLNENYDKSNIYLNGRHWVGLGSKMKTFNLDYQEIIFNKDNLGYIISKTSDPSEISLEIYIMYRLRPEFLIEIFKSFPDLDYQFSFNSIAKDAILDVAQYYSIYDYMKNRTAISEAFLNSVNKAFRSAYIELVLFELGEINFYDSYEEGLIDNIKSMNDATVQNVENSLDISQGNLDNLYSDLNSNINSIMDKAKSNVELLKNKVDNQFITAKINSEAKAYKQFMDSNLGFNSKEISKLILYNKIDFETFFDEDNNFSNKTKNFSDNKLFDKVYFGGKDVLIE